MEAQVRKSPHPLAWSRHRGDPVQCRRNCGHHGLDPDFDRYPGNNAAVEKLTTNAAKPAVAERRTTNAAKAAARPRIRRRPRCRWRATFPPDDVRRVRRDRVGAGNPA